MRNGKGVFLVRTTDSCLRCFWKHRSFPSRELPNPLELSCCSGVLDGICIRFDGGAASTTSLIASD